MVRTFTCAGALALAVLLAAPAAAYSGPAGDSTTLSAQLAAADGDRLRKSCRSKVRRHLGLAKGRHAGMLRIAFTEQCVGNGGRLA